MQVHLGTGVPIMMCMGLNCTGWRKDRLGVCFSAALSSGYQPGTAGTGH